MTDINLSLASDVNIERGGSMREGISNLDFIPEPTDSRILSAIDPQAAEHDQKFRAKVTGWDQVSRRNQSSTTTSRRKPRNFPSAILLLVAVIFFAYVGLQPLDNLLSEYAGPNSDWAKEVSNINQLNDMGYSGEGIRICVVDTGVELNHPDLSHLEIYFKDFLLNNPSPIDNDKQFHGTMVVGILSAKGKVVSGITTNAELSIASALGSYSNSGNEDIVSNAIKWCVDERKADILSLSLGGNQNIESPLEGQTVQAVKYALSKGVFVVAAAGNDGGANDDGRVAAPANVPLVISVGATNEGGELWEFSSRGDPLAGPNDAPRESPNEKPEVIAPGVNIVSTWNDDSYSQSSGTSDATVYVSGALALILESNPNLRPKWNGLDGSNCVLVVKQALMESSRPYKAQSLPHDDRYGYGSLDALEWYQQLKNVESC